MKPELYVKTLGGFKPVLDSPIFDRIGRGEEVMVKITKPRNVRFHRKFMALVKIVFDNQEYYKSADHLRKALTIEAGYFDEWVDHNGQIQRMPKSISFGAMDETEFSVYYDRFLQAVEDIFGILKADLDGEVESETRRN